MANVYFISDIHFGHKNILKFGRCPDGTNPWRSGNDHVENMYNIAENWIRTVTKRDIIWVLGDIAFDQEGFDLLKTLPGRKKMVRGNHDDHFTTQQWLEVFETVESMVKYKGFWLTHCPIHPSELWGKRNIHGHIHQNLVKKEDGTVDDRYVNVCVEHINETPISFEEIRSRFYN